MCCYCCCSLQPAYLDTYTEKGAVVAVAVVQVQLVVEEAPAVVLVELEAVAAVDYFEHRSFAVVVDFGHGRP